MPNFRLINIDEAFYAVKSYVGAQLGCGKLGEWYFSESVANTLVRLLTLPKVELPDDPLEGQVFTSLNRYMPPSTVYIDSYVCTDLVSRVFRGKFSNKSLKNWTTSATPSASSSRRAICGPLESERYGGSTSLGPGMGVVHGLATVSSSLGNMLKNILIMFSPTWN